MGLGMMKKGRVDGGISAISGSSEVVESVAEELACCSTNGMST